MRTRVLIAAGLSIGYFAPLAVADDLSAAASKVIECRSIADDMSRLSCLDEASIALSTALSAGAVTAETPTISHSSTETLPEPAAPKIAKKPNWAQAPAPKVVADNETVEEKKPPIWARVLRPDDESDDEIYAITVVRITRNKTGRIFFYTDSGEIWRQTQVVDVRPPKSLPAAAVVQRSLIGSPSLSFDDVPNRSYKVRRIE